MTPAQRAKAALEWCRRFGGYISYEAQGEAHFETIIEALEQMIAGSALDEGTVRADRKVLMECTACLLMPNNGINDTVWTHRGITLYDELLSQAALPDCLTGDVEEDYRILTGRPYPSAQESSSE